MFIKSLKNKLTNKNLLLGIIILATVLRFYKLGTVPPSLSWDEAAVGYNAYSIANFGKDEWGNTFPLVFKSFEDDKNPVHVYFTAISVFIFDLSEFSTRLPSAIFGVADVVVLYYLAEVLFESSLVGLLAALFLAISPYSLQFSRFNHEANFALFFFMLGILLFFKSFKRSRLISWSFLSFAVSLLSYHSTKIVTPPILFLLMFFYYPRILKDKKALLTGSLFLAAVIVIFARTPALLGTARVNQTTISQSTIQDSELYKKTNNELLGRGEVIARQYLSHYSVKYLFINGDSNSRHSTQAVGEFYKLDALFLVFGLLSLLYAFFKKDIDRKKIMILLVWIFLAPVPASLTDGSPHAARSLFMMGSLHLVAAYGFYKIIYIRRNKYLRFTILGIGLILLMVSLKNYLIYYYQFYPKQSATEWQYGMKEIVGYVADHPEYNRIFMTDERSQPYIFFSYYLKTPVPRFLQTVNYNYKPSRSHNLVSSFGNYDFGDWDPIESMPIKGVLYIVTSSQYDGLRHKALLEVKDVVRYPDGSTAFYLVSSQ